MSLTESVSVINSAIRTLIAVVFVGALGAGGWYGYNQYNAGELEAERTARELVDARSELERANTKLERTSSELKLANSELVKKEEEIEKKDVEISTLNDQVEQQGQEIVRLDTALRLLKVDHRVARITVLEQTGDAAAGDMVSLVRFQELNDEGEAIGEAKDFRIKGDMVYVDSWIVKFDDKYVEEADIDRATSLVLFRRLFGEYREPKDGFALDQAGARPTVYGRGGKMSDFEKRIWDDFWSVANDEAKQEELGIRAAHGEAPSIRVQKGKAYRVELRASDGLSITPDGDAPPQPTKPAA